jgi:hypothetical protein
MIGTKLGTFTFFSMMGTKWRNCSLALTIGLFMAMGNSAWAQAPAPVKLDQAAIQSAYNDGDFDKVVKFINDFTQQNPQMSRADSIFISKHLAVVYSANPQTREKGKYYMYRLLEMMPSAELVDMFVSDEVDRIFEKVRKEFMVRQQNFGVDSTQVAAPNRPASGAQPANATASTSTPTSAPASAPPQKAAASSGSIDPVWWWVAGGAVALGAGITAAIILSQPETEPGPVYVVDVSPAP